MPTLFVKCRKCDGDFPTPIGEAKAGSGGVLISGLPLKCPKCGREDQYSTEDFHIPAAAAAEAEGNVAKESISNEHQAKKELEREKNAGYAGGTLR
jgi:hypothetical protein